MNDVPLSRTMRRHACAARAKLRSQLCHERSALQRQARGKHASRTVELAERDALRDLVRLVEQVPDVQLRGEAGARQVPDAAIALTHNNSGMGEHVVMVYGKEPA